MVETTILVGVDLTSCDKGQSDGHNVVGLAGGGRPTPPEQALRTLNKQSTFSTFTTRGGSSVAESEGLKLRISQQAQSRTVG